MRSIIPAWTCLSLMASAVIADVSFFNNPPKSDDASSVDFSNNPVYAMDDSISVQWNSSFVNVSMLLEQYGNNFRPVLIDNQPNPGSMDWTVSYNDFVGKGFLNQNAVMRFLLYQAPTQNHVYSHFFNLSSAPVAVSSSPPAQTTPSVIVIAPAATSTSTTQTTLAKSVSAKPTSHTATSSPATSATTTTSTSLNFGAAGAASSSTPSAAAASVTSHGLDSSTQAGLGVGLGLGLPLLALMGAILFVMLRRRNKAYQPHGQTWPPYSQSSSSAQTPMSSHPGFANQPQMHAVPIMQAPPPARFINHAHHPSNENGYAPPSALLKPWPEAGPLAGEKSGDYETRTYDAYGRPKGNVTLNEVPGDSVRWGPSEMAAGRMSYGSAKELPALPQTPTTLAGRYEGVLKGS